MFKALKSAATSTTMTKSAATSSSNGTSEGGSDDRTSAAGAAFSLANLSEEQLADLRETFSMFDINGDGSIERHELRHVLRKLGQNPTDQELANMIRSVDDNGDQRIDFAEFALLFHWKKQHYRGGGGSNHTTTTTTTNNNNSSSRPNDSNHPLGRNHGRTSGAQHPPNHYHRRQDDSSASTTTSASSSSSSSSTEEELRDAFAVFDADRSGFIDRKELKRLMKKLGQALSEGEIDAMMEEVDQNGDGVISFEEFTALMAN